MKHKGAAISAAHSNSSRAGKSSSPDAFLTWTPRRALKVDSSVIGWKANEEEEEEEESLGGCAAEGALHCRAKAALRTSARSFAET